MREILGRYKYRGHERLAPLLGLMLNNAYSILQKERESVQRRGNGLQENSIFSCEKSRRAIPNKVWKANLLVPVPVSDARLAERGFNQAERLADVVSRLRGIPQLPLLIRTHHTGKQSFKSRAERLADMKYAFGVNPDESVRLQLEAWLNTAEAQTGPLQIIVVDDIYTTGSTIRACAETIRTLCAGYGQAAEIYSLTWARS
jgi:predicted amidophosphoribosyltransferase